jgi:hypothetical protein
MADTTNPFGGGATGGTGGMFGGGMWGGGGYGQQPSPYGGGYGMQSPWGGGYGGGYGMQSPYGGGYGGFGGGMPYGGGYGMQSPYGAPGGYGMQSPYGGYGGGYSPYGMPQQGYGGGYGMQQSPYYSGYAPQGYSAMPQQQAMMASGAAPQPMAATADSGGATSAADAVTPADASSGGDEAFKNFNIGGSTNQTNLPWKKQEIALTRLWEGSHGAGDSQFPGLYEEMAKQSAAGPLGFDPNSEAALQRMQALAQGGNPMLDASMGAAQGIASGQYGIGTGGMFQNLYGNPGIQTGGRLASLYDQPGIQNLQQYQDMYSNPNIGGIDQYGRMAGQNAVGNADQYQRMIDQGGPIGETFFNDLYQSPGINQEDFRQLANTSNSIDTGRMQDVYGGAQGQGELAGGMFGQVARGSLVNGNPYREQAIQQAMGDTADQVKATMSSRGRYGSDAYGDAMGKALGNVATTARMQGYDTDTANMMAAAQARSGETLARQGIASGAAQSVMNAGGQNFQNQLSALTGLTNAAQLRMQNKLSAAQQLAGAQSTNAAQQLAQIQGLSGIQGQNYQGQLSALSGMNAAQQLKNQQMMAAAQGLTGAQGQNWQNQLGATNALTGVQGQNWQNQLGAANALTGVNSQDIQNRLAAAGMAPAMQGLRYDDSQRLLQAGATREQLAQSQKNYNWDLLNRYSTLAGNVPGTAGTTKDSGSPWWQQGLGAAAMAAGIWGQATPPV